MPDPMYTTNFPFPAIHERGATRAPPSTSLRGESHATREREPESARYDLTNVPCSQSGSG